MVCGLENLYRIRCCCKKGVDDWLFMVQDIHAKIVELSCPPSLFFRAFDACHEPIEAFE